MAVLVAIVAAGFFWRLPYYTLSPGSVKDTEAFIAVEGAPSYQDDAGTVNYLTVSVKQASPFEVLAAWIDPAVEVVEAEAVLGDQTPSENREFNLQLMASSKDSATYQALRRLGYDIPISGTGTVIASVAQGVPAAQVLERGDVVVSANGVPVGVNKDLVDVVAPLPPGSVVELGIQAFEGGETTPVSVELVARPEDPTRSMLGVTTFTRDLTFDFPVDVTIDSGRVGGPSAGLAFTLGILDALTPESVTGGAKVAATGTMGLDGVVGPVGGVHQKTVAASRAGVELMLVPSAEIDEARRYAGDLRVEPVDSLDQALAVLATIGGGDAVLPPPEPEAPIG
jgi:PDZ domain-containing protein